MTAVKPMFVDLAGKTALITGGATGIGKAIARGLARCGANVVINYSKSEQAASQIVAQLKDSGTNAMAICADVTDEQQVAAMTNAIFDEFGSLDILVANAGGPGTRVATADTTESQWNSQFDLNCKSVFYSVKHAIPKFSQGGRIIITSSISARSGAGTGALCYAAAKGAINNMVRNWAKEFASKGITVNAIAPGIIWTRIHEEGTSPEELKKLLERIPLARRGEPEDCVGTVLLLASAEGSYITGQIIEINGGMQMP